MEIKVFGPGCANCIKLEKVVVEVIREMGITEQVQKISDIKEMLSYGIMSTPALVIDGKVKFSGRVPSKDEIKKYLQAVVISGTVGRSII
jgi:small redox-active disulfide protein 2